MSFMILHESAGVNSSRCGSWAVAGRDYHQHEGWRRLIFTIGSAGPTAYPILDRVFDGPKSAVLAFYSRLAREKTGARRKHHVKSDQARRLITDREIQPMAIGRKANNRD